MDKVAQSHKAEAARRQLGTALHLWLEDLDPVSVQVLASGGCEVAEALAKQVGTAHSKFIMEFNDDIKEEKLKGLRNTLWNAMKHASKKNGTPRDDEMLLATPLEKENEERLYEGWFNLSQTMPVPIEAQTLIVWFILKHGDLTELDDGLKNLFPDLHTLSPTNQKAMLRKQIEMIRNIRELVADPNTDPRPLIISAK